jgi:hypothetical protein
MRCSSKAEGGGEGGGERERERERERFLLFSFVLSWNVDIFHSIQIIHTRDGVQTLIMWHLLADNEA